MNISNKIEEIRQKPEHIRIRYVWGLVAISMVVVIIIWVFSLEDSFKKVDSGNGQTLPDFKKSLEELNNMNPSIQEINENPSGNESSVSQPPEEQSQTKEKPEDVKGESSINELNTNDTKEITNPLFPIE